MSTPTIEDSTAAAEPVVERIAQNIVNTLRELTTAAGIYANATVDRPNPALPHDFKDYRLLVVQENEEEDEEAGTADGLLGLIQPFRIVCDAVLPETAQTAIDTVLNRIKADVQKKLREDPQRGGLAWDTVLRPAEMDDTTENARSGTVNVVVAVRYRVLEDDPYKTPMEQQE